MIPRMLVPVLFLAFLLAGCADLQETADPLAPRVSLKPGNGNGGGRSTTEKPASVVIPGTLDGVVVNELESDGLGAYVDGECSVSARIKNIDPDDPDAAYFRFDPLTERNLKKLKCTPRAFSLRLEPSTPVHVSDDPHEDTTLGALGLLSESIADNVRTATVQRFYSVTEGTTAHRRGGITPHFCRDADLRGQPLRFGDPTNSTDSDSLSVTRISASQWQVRTQPFPDNKGWCQHHRADGSTIELLLHVDIGYDVTDLS